MEVDAETTTEMVVLQVQIEIIMVEIVLVHTRHSRRDINVLVLMVGGVL